MTTAAPSAALVMIQPAFTDAERLALAGFLAGYRGLTREAYGLDLRQFTTLVPRPVACLVLRPPRRHRELRIHMVNRITLQPVTIGGMTIPAGRFVVPLVAAANRDPVVFADPDHLDLARDPNPHVAFGGGTHFCIGASLARLEARVVIPSLCLRFPNMQLAARPVWRPSFTIRGFQSVELSLRG